MDVIRISNAKLTQKRTRQDILAGSLANHQYFI